MQQKSDQNSSPLFLMGELQMIILFQTIGKAFIKQEGISSAASVTMEEFQGTPDGKTSTWNPPE